MTRHEGGCLCGNVRYVAESAPLRVTICFCRFCRRATVSTGMVEPIFARAALSVTFGKATRFELPSGGSGTRTSVYFCATCGTKLFLEFERCPDVTGVYAGTFDDPDWFECPPANTTYVFLDMAHEGTWVPAGFNAFREHAILPDGTPVESTIFSGTHHSGP